MRLRLRIERNALPPTQAIWPVKDGKSTIAQLLQHVNDIFPLEGETWGLEDYSVTVGGYECLHYHELSAVCRDEDEVVIRPLEYVEVRARTLTGRSQIAADGRHLVDGVPFGKPCLKGPVRPEVRIPPGKKRKLLSKLLSDGQDEDDRLLITQHGERADDDEEEQDDDDFEVNPDADPSLSSASDSDDSDDSDSSDTDSDSSSSDSDSTSDSESHEESWNGLSASNEPSPKSKTTANLLNGIVMSDLPRTTAGTKRKRGSDSESQETNSLAPRGDSNVSSTKPVPPHEGKPETTERNRRRRDGKKLKHLKETSVLPPDADMSALKAWRDENQKGKSEPTIEADETANLEVDDTAVSAAAKDEAVKRQKVQAPVTSQMPQANAEMHERAHAIPLVPLAVTKKASKRSKPEPNTFDPVMDAFDIKRQKLLSDIASGGIDITAPASTRTRRLFSPFPDAEVDQTEPPEQLSSRQLSDAAGGKARDQETEPSHDQAETATEASTPTRRAQLDIGSSKRLLFGSLGVRVPKTQEERDRVQKKLADRGKRNNNALIQDGLASNGATVDGASAGAEASNEVDEDPDAWRKKLHVTAVECCDEGVELSTPPFPFRQYWDPQYNNKRKKRNSHKYTENSKKRRGKANTEYVETYDKYNINEDGDALNYDEEDVEDEYWEDGALLDDDYEAETQQDDGFPSAPSNLEQHEPLSPDQAKEGDFIAYNELVVDESTGWQPKTVTRVAKIVEAPSATTQDSTTLQLAARDLKPKVFDEEGNRVYGKFEMPDDDAEDDEGRREVSWAELGVVNLVLRPETVVGDG